jgi:hypothetical protein
MVGSTGASARLSVPDQPRTPPRALTDTELKGLLRIGDILIPRRGDSPAISEAPGYERWLQLALASRAESFDVIAREGERCVEVAVEALPGELRRMAVDNPDCFRRISSVLAGAYLMIPEVRQAIGYPGQARRPAPFDQAANEIMHGLLDPVVERGPVFTPVEG